jgi:hypothetical protein
LSALVFPLLTERWLVKESWRHYKRDEAASSSKKVAFDKRVGASDETDDFV